MPACGFAAQMHPGQTHHDTSAQVALCSRRYYDAKARAERAQADDADAEQAAQDMEDDGAREAELAYERKLESAGDDEARLQDEMEARAGVIPFDVALRAAEAAREQAPATGEPVVVHQRRRVDWDAIRRIPVGGRHSAHYALVVDGEVKFYLVERSDSGKWAGRTFAKVQAGPAYHRLEKGAQIGVLARIAADPLAAARLYAGEVGQCSQCNSPLTDDESRARGMGPVCAGRFGSTA